MKKLVDIADAARRASAMAHADGSAIAALRREVEQLCETLLVGQDIDPALRAQLSSEEMALLTHAVLELKESQTNDGAALSAALNEVAGVFEAALHRSPDATPATAQTRISRYVDLAEIDSGAYAHLFRAFDTKLQRFVAIKIFRSQKTSSFVLQQARATAHLKNRYVVTIHDVDFVEHPKDRTLCEAIVMELVEGESLEKRLQRAPIGAEAALAFGRQIIDGVRLILSSKRYHEDIHTGNILIRNDTGDVVIVDAQGAAAPGRPESHAERFAWDLRCTQVALAELIGAVLSTKEKTLFEKQQIVEIDRLQRAFETFLLPASADEADRPRQQNQAGASVDGENGSSGNVDARRGRWERMRGGAGLLIPALLTAASIFVFLVVRDGDKDGGDASGTHVDGGEPLAASTDAGAIDSEPAELPIVAAADQLKLATESYRAEYDRIGHRTRIPPIDAFVAAASDLDGNGLFTLMGGGPSPVRVFPEARPREVRGAALLVVASYDEINMPRWSRVGRTLSVYGQRTPIQGRISACRDGVAVFAFFCDDLPVSDECELRVQSGDATEAVTKRRSKGQRDTWLGRFDGRGRLVWGGRMIENGPEDIALMDIACDAQDTVTIALHVPSGPTPLQPARGRSSLAVDVHEGDNIVLLKFDDGGSAVFGSVAATGAGSLSGDFVAVHPDGSVSIAGAFDKPLTLSPHGAPQRIAPKAREGFVALLSKNGDASANAIAVLSGDTLVDLTDLAVVGPNAIVGGRFRGNAVLRSNGHEWRVHAEMRQDVIVFVQRESGQIGGPVTFGSPADDDIQIAGPAGPDTFLATLSTEDPTTMHVGTTRTPMRPSWSGEFSLDVKPIRTWPQAGYSSLFKDGAVLIRSGGGPTGGALSVAGPPSK